MWWTQTKSVTEEFYTRCKWSKSNLWWRCVSSGSPYVSIRLRRPSGWQSVSSSSWTRATSLPGDQVNWKALKWSWYQAKNKQTMKLYSSLTIHICRISCWTTCQNHPISVVYPSSGEIYLTNVWILLAESQYNLLIQNITMEIFLTSTFDALRLDECKWSIAVVCLPSK